MSKARDGALVSGTISAVQQLGNCVDIALIGLVYFAATTAVPGVAFKCSLVYHVGVIALLEIVSALPSRRVATATG